MMTLKEAVAWYKAAIKHIGAIAKPFSRCSMVPCPICASQGELYRLAAEARLDDFKSCPQWLIEGIDFYRQYPSFYAEGQRARYNGMGFEFIR